MLRALIVVAIVITAGAVAWIAWPRGAAPPAARDAGVARAVPPPVRVPDRSGAAGPAVRFALRDRKGAPVAGVDVRAAPPSGALASATSGSDGTVTLPLGPGRWHLTVAEHRVAGAADLEIDGPIAHDVAILVDPAEAPPPEPEDLGRDRSGGLTGVITGGGAHLDDVTIAPTYLGAFGPGKPVKHDRLPHPIAIPPRRFLGAPAGYKWPELPAGGYDLVVTSPGWGAAHLRATVEPTGWGVGTVELVPAGSISGVVQDGRGVAVSGVTVRAEVDDHLVDEATTGGDGIYVVDELPAGVVTLSARVGHDACTPARDIVTVEAGKRATHRIEMVCAWQGH